MYSSFLCNQPALLCKLGIRARFGGNDIIQLLPASIFDFCCEILSLCRFLRIGFIGTVFELKSSAGMGDVTNPLSCFRNQPRGHQFADIQSNTTFPVFPEIIASKPC